MIPYSGRSDFAKSVRKIHIGLFCAFTNRKVHGSFKKPLESKIFVSRG